MIHRIENVSAVWLCGFEDTAIFSPIDVNSNILEVPYRSSYEMVHDAVNVERSEESNIGKYRRLYNRETRGFASGFAVNEKTLT